MRCMRPRPLSRAGLMFVVLPLKKLNDRSCQYHDGYPSIKLFIDRMIPFFSKLRGWKQLWYWLGSWNSLVSRKCYRYSDSAPYRFRFQFFRTDISSVPYRFSNCYFSVLYRFTIRFYIIYNTYSFIPVWFRSLVLISFSYRFWQNNIYQYVLNIAIMILTF